MSPTSALADAFAPDLYPEPRKADLTLTLRLYGHITPALLVDLKEDLTKVLVTSIKLHALDGGSVELDAPGVEEPAELASTGASSS